jgi:hypothetical protein
MLCNSCYAPVIPAEAGICEKTWIPAFAGMTAGQDNRPIYVRLRNISCVNIKGESEILGAEKKKIEFEDLTTPLLSNDKSCQISILLCGQTGVECMNQPVGNAFMNLVDLRIFKSLMGRAVNDSE